MRIIQVQPELLVQLLSSASSAARPTASAAGSSSRTRPSLVVTDSEIVDNEAGVRRRNLGGRHADAGEDDRRVERRGGRRTRRRPGRWRGLAPGMPATMVNTTLSGNDDDGQGGGLYTQRSSVLQNVSIVGNEAPPRVAGVLQRAAGSSSRSPSGAAADARDERARGAQRERRMWRDGRTSPSTRTTALIDESAAHLQRDRRRQPHRPDAFLGALEFNGGLTRTHCAPGEQPGDRRRRLVCSGDQRGVSRPFGPACDVGAFERNTLPTSTCSPTTWTERARSPTARCASGSTRPSTAT